jgi:hypothetical protein
MLKITKYIVYLLIALTIWALFWFLPKYSYVQKNPGYCANLTKHLYYCGTQADLKAMFETTIENKDKIRDQVQDQVQQQNQ